MPIKEWKQLKEDLNEKAIYGLDTLVKDASDEELNEDLIVYEGEDGREKAENIVKAYTDAKDINTKKCLYDAMNTCLFQLYDDYTNGEYDRWKELDEIHRKWKQELQAAGELKEAADVTKDQKDARIERDGRKTIRELKNKISEINKYWDDPIKGLKDLLRDGVEYFMDNLSEDGQFSIPKWMVNDYENVDDEEAYEYFHMVATHNRSQVEKEFNQIVKDEISKLESNSKNKKKLKEDTKGDFKNLVQNIESERIKDELKARQDYINDAKVISDAGKNLDCDCGEKIAALSKDIAKEENVHVGELEQVIDKVTDGEFLKNTEEGHKEAKEKLESGDINENLEEYYGRPHDDFVSRIESILDEAGIFYGDVVDYADEGHVNIVGVDKEEQEEAQLALQDNFPKATITIPGDNYKEGEDDEIILNYQISYPFKVWYNENRSEEELKSHELSDPNERCDEIIWIKASNKREAEDKLNYNGDIFKWENDDGREDEIEGSKLTESTISELTPEQQNKFNSRISELIRNFIVEQEALQENGLNRIRDTIRKEFNLTDFETKHVQLAMVRFMEMMRKTAEQEAEKVEDEIEDISKMN